MIFKSRSFIIVPLYVQNTDMNFFITGESNESLFLGIHHFSRGWKAKQGYSWWSLRDCQGFHCKNHIAEVDLLKIDVEEAEWKILNDFARVRKRGETSRQYLNANFHLKPFRIGRKAK